MSIPTQKHTKSRKKIRRGAVSVAKTNLSKCSKCGQPVRPHHACDNCGNYKGKPVIKVRVPKKFRKKKSKQDKK